VFGVHLGVGGFTDPFAVAGCHLRAEAVCAQIRTILNENKTERLLKNIQSHLPDDCSHHCRRVPGDDLDREPSRFDAIKRRPCVGFNVDRKESTEKVRPKSLGGV